MMFHSSTMFEMLVKPDEVIKLKKWYKVLNIREENICQDNCESNHHNVSHDCLCRAIYMIFKHFMYFKVMLK